MKTTGEIKKEIIEIIDEFSDDTGTFIPYTKWQFFAESIVLYLEPGEQEAFKSGWNSAMDIINEVSGRDCNDAYIKFKSIKP